VQTQLEYIARGRYRLPQGFDPANSPFHIVSLHTDTLNVPGGRVLIEGGDFTFSPNRVELEVPYLKRMGMNEDKVVLDWVPGYSREDA
jgi:hypothetical protein